jgi:hypothetical protein
MLIAGFFFTFLEKFYRERIERVKERIDEKLLLKE